ncbi:dual specificity protein phosphatase 12-like isoform X2 [Anneissia japonica]|uniref:dual specificity protein phosphatase 12-like isoform X2 n=1 Tax=Anneissia japonica TaxID=1529436 RepID=UPI0014254EFF|nr:dual specificity protein phosphatase 12-like isoform X2 [Anneissia japonica]
MDMDSIRPGLFLGSLDSIKNVSFLTDMGIKHVLSIMSEKPEMSQEIVQKFVQVDDDPEANILQFLPECTEFLNHGLQKGGVLVHCYGGVSRSASVVTAYLMEKECINVEEAVYEVKKSRSAVMPNDGFMTQLQLYHMMGNRIDQTDPRYKRFCLVQWAKKVRFGIEEPQHTLADDPQHSSTTQEVIFKCRKCRRVLISRENVIGHDQGTGQEAFKWHKRSSPVEVASDPTRQSTCTSLFIEPVSWMKSAVVGTIQGKIACPKCSAKIGSFNWSGEQCSCGAWVTPSFQVHLNKLDKVIQCPIPQAQPLS